MFVDTLIQRLITAGFPQEKIHDYRAKLPRNGTWMVRPISAIKQITWHYDAEFRPVEYDSFDRYKRQAQYHINKDWGGGAHGDGLMYAVKVDNLGDIFFCRDFEHVLWHCGNPNYGALSLNGDCGGDQMWTREQVKSIDFLTDVLTTKCPEFPAEAKDVYGHTEMIKFGGTATACPGRNLSGVQEYRRGSNITLSNYAPNYGEPAPAPTPPPVPQKPEYERNAQDFAPATFYAKKDTELIDLTDGSKGQAYLPGQSFLMRRRTSVGGVSYLISVYSADKNIWKGIRESDLTDQDPQPPIPEPKPIPNPTPMPEPTPNPEPTPDPIIIEPTPNPVPVPVVTPPATSSMSFYLTILAHILSAITASGALVNTGNEMIDGIAQVIGVITAILVQFGYNANAAKVKIAAIQKV